MRITLLGIGALPSGSGGRDTAAEEIGSRLVKLGHEVTAFVRDFGPGLVEHRGMRIAHRVGTRHYGAAELKATSRAISRGNTDVAIVFDTGATPITPLSRVLGAPVAIHLDSDESRRARWRGIGARYYDWSESISVQRADAVIANSWRVAEDIQQRYGRTCAYIPYDASTMTSTSNWLRELDLTPGSFHLVVARFEPENQVLEMIRAYQESRSALRLVVVGTSPHSPWHVDAVREVANADRRVRYLGGVYDQDLLDQLYAGCATYLHGGSLHEGSQNLLRAVGVGARILAFDVDFHRTVTRERAEFWSTPGELTSLLASADMLTSTGTRKAVADDALERSMWDDVAEDYEHLAFAMSGRTGIRAIPQSFVPRLPAETTPAATTTGHLTVSTAAWPMSQPAKSAPPVASDTAAVVITQDGERWLEEQLDSILTQTVLPAAILVVDDHSRDGTLGLVREIARSAAVPIEWRRVDHGHAPDLKTRIARTVGVGLAWATQEHDIALLADHDDSWLPERLASQRQLLEETDALLVAGDAVLMDEAGRPLDGRLRDHFPLPGDWGLLTPAGRMAALLRVPFVTGAAMAVTAECVRLMTPIPGGWLHDRWASLVATARGRLAVQVAPVIRYRIHDAQAVGHRHASTGAEKARWQQVLARGASPLDAVVRARHVEHRLRPLAMDASVAAELTWPALVRSARRRTDTLPF